jgi:hypothetical protein
MRVENGVFLGRGRVGVCAVQRERNRICMLLIGV